MKIVNFTPTGVIPSKENSLAPLTANEVIEETQMLYENGMITLVHIHARDKKLLNTHKAKHFQPIIEGLRKYCPDLAICASLSGRYTQDIDERSEVLQLNPDMGSLTLGSWNYSTGVNINSPQSILHLINRMQELNVVPELECFDTGMINYAKYLINKAILKSPIYLNVIFGNLSNAQISEVDYVMTALDGLPENSKICFGGIGESQELSVQKGMQLVDGCRVGLEDNLFISGSRVKASNYLLVKKAIGANQVMPPKEFKKWLKSL